MYTIFTYCLVNNKSDSTVLGINPAGSQSSTSKSKLFNSFFVPPKPVQIPSNDNPHEVLRNDVFISRELLVLQSKLFRSSRLLYLEPIMRDNECDLPGSVESVRRSSRGALNSELSANCQNLSNFMEVKSRRT